MIIILDILKENEDDFRAICRQNRIDITRCQHNPTGNLTFTTTCDTAEKCAAIAGFYFG